MTEIIILSMLTLQFFIILIITYNVHVDIYEGHDVLESHGQCRWFMKCISNRNNFWLFKQESKNWNK
jgi:hypothetical protein